MDQLKDITDVFFNSLRHIQNEKGPESDGNRVVKSALFDLLEGARAVEVNNPRLDTGLIVKTLTKEEIEFDCFKAITESELIALINMLLRLLMAWLDNSSLPVTVLSCRYVQEIVYKYTTDANRGMDKFYLGDGLANEVLKTAVVAVSKFVGIVITVSNTVLYEEEDLTTRAMDLNFLNEVMIDDVIEGLESTIEAVLSSEFDQKPLIVYQLRLLISINKLPILFNLPVDLFAASPQPQTGFISVLDEGLQRIKHIVAQKHQYETKSIPNGSVSRYIQTSLGNRNIPGDTYDVSFDETFRQLEHIFTEIKDVFIKSTKLQNMKQFLDFTRYDVQLQAHKFHVITRGLFQLFLVRDDQKIVGSAFGLGDIALEMMNYVNLYNCNIINSKTWNLNTMDTDNVVNKLNEFLKDLDVGTYQNFTIFGHNRCRQRQIINRNLLIWDTLQVQAEKLEVDLHTNFKINDKSNETDEVCLPLSSYVYYTKVELMVEFLLIGIELELYKEYEILTIYWYLHYLLKVLVKHIDERVVGFNRYKLQKLAKQKKKSKNKTEIDEKRGILNNINDYMIHKLQYYTMLQKLINNVSLLLNHYHNEGLVKLDETSSNFASNFESLFNLRFKPFSSIGVPERLQFQQYLNSFVPGITRDEIAANFETSKTELQLFAKTCTNAKEAEWVNSLVKVCFSYLLELKGDNGVFSISRGYNPYFPKFINKEQKPVGK